MTTLEHVLLGANGVLAAGLHRKYGWQLVAMTGIAATLPDWDGFSIFGGMTLFDKIHRAWGHGLLPCMIVSLLFAVTDYRFDLMTRLGRLFVRVTRITINPDLLIPRVTHSSGACVVWIIAALLAGLSHLIADIVFSGHPQYAHWGIQIFWPFSNQQIDGTLVPWGDIGVVLIFILGMFAMLRWKSRTQKIALITLGTVVIYLAVRGTCFPMS